MSTGWKWTRDDGEEYKSRRDAMLGLRERPESTFRFSELDMSGVRERDVTDELRRALRDGGSPMTGRETVSVTDELMLRLMPGTRIRLLDMPNDPCPIEPGTTGTVRTVYGPYRLGRDDPPRYHVGVDWDARRSLALVVPPDRFEVLP